MVLFWQRWPNDVILHRSNRTEQKPWYFTGIKTLNTFKTNLNKRYREETLKTLILLSYRILYNYMSFCASFSCNSMHCSGCSVLPQLKKSFFFSLGQMLSYKIKIYIFSLLYNFDIGITSRMLRENNVNTSSLMHILRYSTISQCCILTALYWLI